MIVWKSENASMTIENIKPEDIQPIFFKIMESVIKNECAKMMVDEILENRIKLAHNLLTILKEIADTWGLKISSVNISNLVVSNDKFMHNMALPKEIEI
jgi:regulator of protease activity HflC (stomatin/prohibitin superfamily)